MALRRGSKKFQLYPTNLTYSTPVMFCKGFGVDGLASGASRASGPGQFLQGPVLGTTVPVVVDGAKHPEPDLGLCNRAQGLDDLLLLLLNPWRAILEGTTSTASTRLDGNGSWPLLARQAFHGCGEHDSAA